MQDDPLAMEAVPGLDPVFERGRDGCGGLGIEGIGEAAPGVASAGQVRTWLCDGMRRVDENTTDKGKARRST